MISEQQQHTDKKAIFGWVMYDFANSSFTTLIVTFVYATYFTKAIAENPISGTVLWGRAITVTALTVAVLSPLLGRFADKTNRRKQFLFLFTLIAVISSAMLYRPLPGEVLKALIWFTIGNIAFEMGMVFYNSFLPDIATRETTGRLSGLGWGVGYFGGLAAMIIAMVCFVNPDIPWFGLAKASGQNIRATNILVALWFALFSIPFFLFVQESKHPKQRRINAPNFFAKIKQTIADLTVFPQTIKFLLARLIYNDGLITIFAFGGIYAAGTFNFSFQEIMAFGITLNIAAGIGALVFGVIDDRVGSRTTIFFSLFGLIVAALLALLTTNRVLFWTAGILIGIFSGPNQSASRSLMAKFTPHSKESEFFGFFALSGKFTAFLGPIFLSITTDFFNSQRAGMTVVLLFFIGGALLLGKVDEKKGIQAAIETK
jgi:UMF1 family MFS transporter